MDSERILFFISSLKCGGAENHLLNLCRYLSSAFRPPAVYTLSAGDDGLEGKFKDIGIEPASLDLPSLKYMLAPGFLKRIKRIISEEDHDIIHAHLYHGEVVGGLASFFSDAPLIVTRHSSGLEFNGARRIVSRIFLKKLERLIAVSPQAGEEARMLGTDPSKISVIENGVDTSLFRPMTDDSRESKKADLLNRLFGAGTGVETQLVGSLGGLRPVKNYELFVRMAAEIRAKGALYGHSDVRFVVFGEGPCKESLIGLAEELGIGDIVSFPGRTDSPEDILPLLDMFVLTSDSEGVPIALLEAMSSALPCIASRVGGVPEVAGDAGILVKEGALDGFTREVASLLLDSDRKRSLSELARVRAVEKYGIERWGARTVDVYDEVLRA